MSKTNIKFNNAEYQIDESVLAPATAELKSHLSTVMNGSGATINFDGTAYGIDSTKLSSATTEFVSHLDTIAGSGAKVVIGGVEYGIDSTKVSDAISQLEAAFGGVGEERLEGDGAEYYTLAPTALSFRSTAPLNELQDVQINGVTVDPSNYTLEEGSTIVTFPIDYLKTLDVGNYEVTVASDSKTVKGDFTVAAPELNEYGFYYNQPYTAYVSVLDENIAFFLKEDGLLDIISGIGGNQTSVETGDYAVNGSGLTINCSLGTFTGTISNDGMVISCNELGVTFELSDESCTADKDYIYTYHNEDSGYVVTAIDKTKVSYDAIRNNINGIPTLHIGIGAFKNNVNLVTMPIIPKSVIHIGDDAFKGCTGLTSVSIPEGVTSIGVSVFNGCTNLTSVIIADSVVRMDYYVFYNCTNLSSATFIDTTNWYVRYSSSQELSELICSDLSDKSTAANYLTDKYCERIWKKQ